MNQLDEALRRYFGFAEFRQGQREVLERILTGRHTLAVLPTGLGKSLCYQLASQLLPGLTLVISPLVALMQDQVESLLRRGFQNVTFLSSALEPAQVGARYTEIEQGRYKLVYVAPERCDSPRFRQLVRQAGIDLLVIDEAHCISQWGHDFRPHYRSLLTRLPELKQATMLALTATATLEVQDDIAAALGQPEIGRVIADFNRPNLHFESIRVDKHDDKDARLLELLAGKDESAIVYASTRKEAEHAYRLLLNRGFDACLYHAGLEAGERASTQRRFQRGDSRTIVATVAFGLGIDKPDIRRVVHYNIPGSLESYYQEAGRAGRDGAPAVCTLLYSQRDLRVQRFMIDNSYPEPEVVFQLYERLLDAHPLPVPVDDLAIASELPSLTVNAALQLLQEQRWLTVTQDGKYQIAHPETARPRVDFRPLSIRRKRANERLKLMVEYAAGQSCRRALILNYFGQKFSPPCDGCDICCPQDSREDRAQGSELPASETSNRTARIILRTVAEFGGRLGRLLIADVLSGSKQKRILDLRLNQSEHYGALSLHRRGKVIAWIDELVEQGLLGVTAEEFPRLQITSAGREALNADSLLPLTDLRDRTQPKSISGDDKGQSRTSSEPERDLSLRLEMWRQGAQPPDPEALLDALDNHSELERGGRVIVVNALKDLGVKAAGETLLRLLGDTSDGNLLSAVSVALGHLGVKHAVPDLIELLRDERAGVRRAAARALGALRCRDAAGKLERLMKEDESDNVRLAARAALILLRSEPGKDRSVP